MKIYIVSAFPKLFEGPLTESIIRRAISNKLVEINLVDLRDYADDKHKQVDDYPYGGGPGMVLKPEPFFYAVEDIQQKCSTEVDVIMLTPQGEIYDQKIAHRLMQEKELIFLCGHYKGIDERVREHLVTRELSIGDYILTGGELAAMVVVDSVVRLLPGAINDIESAKSDSFENGVLDCGYYTRPENFKGLRVPGVLLNGDHSKIAEWRREHALKRTQEKRKDLLSPPDHKNILRARKPG